MLFRNLTPKAMRPSFLSRGVAFRTLLDSKKKMRFKTLLPANMQGNSEQICSSAPSGIRSFSSLGVPRVIRLLSGLLDDWLVANDSLFACLVELFNQLVQVVSHVCRAPGDTPWGHRAGWFLLTYFRFGRQRLWFSIKVLSFEGIKSRTTTW